MIGIFLLTRFFLSLLLIVTGVLHLLKISAYVSIVPSYLPFPKALVIFSGLASILLGLLLIPSKTVKLAGWGAMAYFVAVFPANIHMALNPELFPAIPMWGLWLRLPFQAALIFWAFGYARNESV